MNKIILRAVEPEDVDFMFECESDPLSARWSDYRAPLSRNQLTEYALTYDASPFRAGQLRLIAVLQAQGEEGEYRGVENPVGIIDLYDISEKDLRAFAGITIHPLYRNSGLGLETLKALQIFAADRLGLSSLVAKVSTQNPVALSLFEKAGFQRLALLPHWHRIGNTFHDFHLLVSQF